jgi:hypothetical protein
MTVQELQGAIAQKPFKPFLIKMADGETFRITHPDFIWYPKPSRTVHVYDERSDRKFILDLVLMSQLVLTTSEQDVSGSEGEHPPSAEVAA